MTPCADLRASRLLLLALAASLFVGCAARTPRPDDTPAPGPTTTEDVAEPADLGDPEGRFAEALQMMRTGQSVEAVAAFMALGKDFPEFSGPPTNLGILHAQADRLAPAIAALERATQANPDNKVAYNWLGVLHREGRQYDKARAAYEKALAADPDYAAARLNLGLLYEDHLRQPAEALVQYREYLRITDGKDLRVLPWIGEIEATMAAQTESVAPASAAPEEREVK